MQEQLPKDLAFGEQTMVWEDPSDALRMTEINNIASFLENAVIFYSETIFNRYKATYGLSVNSR